MAIAPKETDDTSTLPRPTKADFDNRQLNLIQNLLFNTEEERERVSHASSFGTAHRAIHLIAKP
jgi:hypothetical protein